MGPSYAYDVSVTDTIDTNQFSVDSWYGSPSNIATGSGTSEYMEGVVTSLPPSQTVYYYVSVIYQPGLKIGDVLLNEAIVLISSALF